jgi:hypothetical protein
MYIYIYIYIHKYYILNYKIIIKIITLELLFHTYKYIIFLIISVK